jgi:chromosome segregation ATPase
MEMLLERLQLLDAKVRETLTALAQARAVQEGLEEQVRRGQAELKAREQEVASLRAEREREGVELNRLRAEREEVRKQVEGLLEEIARLETALQTAGSPGVGG